MLGLLIGAATTAMIGIGDRLGLYRALAEGPRTSATRADEASVFSRLVATSPTSSPSSSSALVCGLPQSVIVSMLAGCALPRDRGSDQRDP